MTATRIPQASAAALDPELEATREAMDGLPLGLVLSSGAIVEGRYCGIFTDKAKSCAELLRAISDRTTGCHVLRDVSITSHGKTIHANIVAIDPKDIQLFLGIAWERLTRDYKPTFPSYLLSLEQPSDWEGITEQKRQNPKAARARAAETR